jgi:hypothetical protein
MCTRIPNHVVEFLKDLPPEYQEQTISNIINEPNITYETTPKKKHNKPKHGKTPRPPNAFILYRMNKQQLLIEQNPDLSNNEVSKIIGEM